ncbi:MAG: response regulator [Acidobacteriota bacterium]
MRKFSIPDPYTPGLDVLIFSNNLGFISHHRSILLSIGFVPIIATTLKATLAVLRSTALELVIVDEEAGVQQTQRILERIRDDSPKVPVLVVSPSSDAELRRQALDLGAAVYLDRSALQDDVVQALLPDRPLRGDSLQGPQRI